MACVKANRIRRSHEPHKHCADWHLKFSAQRTLPTWVIPTLWEKPIESQTKAATAKQMSLVMHCGLLISLFGLPHMYDFSPIINFA
jgi:hypothetical protein